MDRDRIKRYYGFISYLTKKHDDSGNKKVESEDEPSKEIQDIFIEEGNMPASYHRAYGSSYEYSMGPSGVLTSVKTPINPEDRF